MRNKDLKCEFLNFPDSEFAKIVENTSYEGYVAKGSTMCFIYLHDDTPKNRVLLRKLMSFSEPTHYIVVSPHIPTSYLTWQANLFAFLTYKESNLLNSTKWLRERLLTYPVGPVLNRSKLKLNFKGGFDLLEIREICFFVGSGNYTDIYLKNGVRKCISYPLSNLENRLNNIGYIKRIGKSFIVNTNMVKRVQTDRLIFKGEKEIQLELSNTYIKRVKKELLWY